MKISVIIPTYNRKQCLALCLASIINQTCPAYEVYVIDDASTDQTDLMVKQDFPMVHLVRQLQNTGPAAARNRGIKSSTGEIVAFIDDDCIAPSNWLEKHLKYYIDSKIGAVGGPQTPKTKNIFDKFDIAHYAEQFYSDVRRIKKVNGRDFLATSNMSVRKEVLDTVGLFDETFLLPAGEDFDLSKRIVHQGKYHLISDPRLSVEHLKVHDLKSYLRMRFRRGYGSVTNDIKEGSLSARHFIPFPNLTLAWQDWRNFRNLFETNWFSPVRFWGLVFLARWVEVAGRLYYYPKIKKILARRNYDSE